MTNIPQTPDLTITRPRVRSGDRHNWQYNPMAAQLVAENKIFYVYLADGEAAIKKHAEMSGIPFSTITEVSQIFDPTTADN
jgi:hypothetical protein